MAINLDQDLSSVGGGYGGYGLGSGGYGFLPWLFLLLLGKDGGFGGNNCSAAQGVNAGLTQAKLDCLEVGQQNLAKDIAGNSLDMKFNSLNNEISELASIGRDAQTLQLQCCNDTKQLINEWGCKDQIAHQATQTAIAMQTRDINENTNAGVASILAKLNDNAMELLRSENDQLRAAANRNEILAAIAVCCNNGGPGSHDVVPTANKFAQASTPQILS